MCPDECPGLQEVHGAEFEALYEKYENENRGRKTVQATDLFYAIVESQIETGTPYMLYKDACNGKSNQQNLGTIKCSNLCTEIVEYTSPTEFAVCNLASICLSKYVVLSDCQPNTNAIKVYSIDNCKYCAATKKYLTQKACNEVLVEEKDKSAVLDSLNTEERTFKF